MKHAERSGFLRSDRSSAKAVRMRSNDPFSIHAGTVDGRSETKDSDQDDRSVAHPFARPTKDRSEGGGHYIAVTLSRPTAREPHDHGSITADCSFVTSMAAAVC